ncbi:hypothetical protein OG455_27160 [Kitasatospora sp. NBC_01287]|uniref:hypothetical protein n=1 Tax=Kitasatospora sp. NBC_01287 TaxID=2903573 RepID=UPI00225B5578|nr:hypothetical protein [Kitasatospora sp. NBC_01287]MCX4749143.1 hypothetical protein [Kitasatospora sp. NBC_01287]
MLRYLADPALTLLLLRLCRSASDAVMLWLALRGTEARHRAQIIKALRTTNTWQPTGNDRPHAGGEHRAASPGSPERLID